MKKKVTLKKSQTDWERLKIMSNARITGERKRETQVSYKPVEHR